MHDLFRQRSEIEAREMRRQRTRDLRGRVCFLHGRPIQL